MIKMIKTTIKRLIPPVVIRAMVRKQHLSPDFPSIIGVNLNETKCILRCRMCPQYNKKPAESKWIEPKLFYKLIDELPDSKNISFEIASYGETLVTKYWKELILYQQRNKPKLQSALVTNGAILNDDIIDFLLSNPPYVVQLSLDAGTPETYEWLTGSKHYKKAADNLRKFAEERARRGLRKPILRTHIIEMKELINDIPVFLKKWQDIIDVVHVRHLGNWGGAIDDNECTPMWNPPKKRYPCAWPFFATKIVPSGEVHKCFIHFLSNTPGVGNLNSQTLREIWHGNRLKEVRTKHLEGRYEEEPMCEKCNIWALFPNIWKTKEYCEGIFTGKQYPEMPFLFGEDGRDIKF